MIAQNNLIEFRSEGQHADSMSVWIHYLKVLSALVIERSDIHKKVVLRGGFMILKIMQLCSWC